MIVRWFIGNDVREPLRKRGGAGYGITTTATSVTSYGVGPPSSTVDKWRGTGKQPNIAGSTGGFIGLLSGIVILVLISTFIGIYLWNRHRRRTQRGAPPSTSQPLTRRSRPILPTLSLSRPSTDPYAHDPYATSGAELNETPRAAAFGFHFGRPVYTRSRSSEWEMGEAGGTPSPSKDVWGSGTGGKGKGKGVEVDMPIEPGEAAWPLRGIHPRVETPTRYASGGSGGSSGKGKGRSTEWSTSSVSSTGSTPSALHNPFESPYDPASAPGAGYPPGGAATGGENETPTRPSRTPSNPPDRSLLHPPGGYDEDEGSSSDGSGSGSGSDGRSVRVPERRGEGSRFVERFDESRESLA
ncbi:hypothetical protein IAT38_001214 [Cryptococcus sp. DSM 104549]